MKQTTFLGFSLIELMIVIVMISILAVVAVPSYHHYIKRARFTEIIAAAAVFQTAVALALQQGIPVTELTNGAYGIPSSPPPTPHIAQLQVKRGVIIVLTTALLDHVTYMLIPNQDGSHWTVQGTCLAQGLCHDDH